MKRFTTLTSLKRTAIFLIVVMTISPVAMAQFREEIGSLEAKYESRARAVLNTVLKPYEYSLVIAVDIDRDETRLKELEAEYEKNLLPGMPGTSGYDSPTISNQLYEMKTKIEVHLVVGETVSKDRQETAGALLKMKLRIEEKNGDLLTIVRSKLPNSVEEENPVEKLPELSWKMWILIVVIGLLFLSGMFFYWSRRNSTKENNNENTSNTENKKVDSDDKDKENDETVAASTSTHGREPFLDVQLDPNEVLFESKQQILSLATQYPQATIQALTEHFQKGEENDVLLMCESFGFEVAKKIFSDLSPRIWGKLGFLLVQRKDLPKTSAYSAAVNSCSRVILKKFLELGQEDTKNPFGFIWKLTSTDRSKLLDGESAASIALICLHSDQQQMADLFETLTTQQQEAITMHIVRLEKVSDSAIKSTVDLLNKKLRLIKENPELVTNGIAIAAELLKTLPADKEFVFFEKMKQENPAQAEKIRRFSLMYQDLVYVPGDVIADAVSLLDLSVVVLALRKGHEDVKAHVLASLPPKKSMMIDKDLKFLEANPSAKQVAEAKRSLLAEVRSLVTARGLELEQIIPIETKIRDVSQGAA